jgi:murein DD-endopeptidase MepM/ murein hydrolase activator NlpD
MDGIERQGRAREARTRPDPGHAAPPARAIAPAARTVDATAGGIGGKWDKGLVAIRLGSVLNHLAVVGGGLQTRYGQMSRLAVATDEMVKKGDVIGYVGSTGRSTGPHLHYEMRLNGNAVRPTR